MKITITPDDWMQIDADDVEQALLFIQGLRDSVHTDAPVEEEPHTIYIKAKRGPQASPPVELTPALVETWEWLVRNDADLGIPVESVAEAFTLSYQATTFRLTQLLKKGAAIKVSPGRYRAVWG